MHSAEPSEFATEEQLRYGSLSAGRDTVAHSSRLQANAVRNLERVGVARSVAMKLMGHKTEAVYRRYAIVCESDLKRRTQEACDSRGFFARETSAHWGSD